MKKILLLSMLGFCAVAVKAQTTYFTQNFDTPAADATAVTAAYVQNPASAYGNNLFTHINSGSNVAISVNSGKLRFLRSVNTGTGAQNTAYAIRSTIGGGGSLAKFNATTPTFLKIGFEVSIAHSASSNTPNDIFCQLGSGLAVGGYSGTPGTPDAVVYAQIGIGLSNSASNSFFVAKPTGAGNASTGIGTDRTNIFSGTQQITWYLNNTGSTVSYLAPDGVTSYTLANDTWAIFIGNSREASGGAVDAPDVAMNEFNIVARGVTTIQTIDIDNISVSSPAYTVLPVSLVSFTGKSTTNGNLLAWKTASESNNSHFEVLRSADGKTFSSIGTVKGKGNATELSAYSFTDASPLAGTSYYKLNQIDFDGTAKESDNVVALANSLQTANALAVSSKNGNVQLSFNAPNSGNADVKVYDLNGKTLLNKQVNATQGLNILNYSLSLPKGVYVGYVNVGGSVLRTKFYN